MTKNISDIAFIVQARLNSERLKNKMIKNFNDSNLFEILLNKLEKSSLIPDKNVYLSVHEKELKDIAKNFKFNVYERSYKSANEDNDIKTIYEWWDKIPHKYVILISACNPLLKTETIEKFTEDFISSKKEGSFAVFEKKTYYWDQAGRSLTDWKNSKIMNTKIVEPVYEAGHCLYASRASFLKNGCWMDNKTPPEPNLFVVDELECFDIDYPWQFKIAEKLHREYINGEL
jgi:CMP-N-acetylneuraminic acid synthetase